MKTSTKQSRKQSNARTITNLHYDVSHARSLAATFYQMAKESRDDARAMTKEIKKLASQQVQLKRELKGPPKAKRPAKADSREGTGLAVEMV
jgi:hypothetical protein